MGWFRRWFGQTGGGSTPDGGEFRAVGELLDQDHPRASISDGDRIIVEPSKVLGNIRLAMERVDLDINTPISIEEDVAPLDELTVMVQTMKMGSLLAVHVVNTAMAIMSARYPSELVRRPLPPDYDLRKITPVDVEDEEHDVAKQIFNKRTTSSNDLTEDDIETEFRSLSDAQQMQVFVILFYMYGTKIGAMKHRTGIE